MISCRCTLVCTGVITLLSAGTLIEFNITFTLPSLSCSLYTQARPNYWPKFGRL